MQIVHAAQILIATEVLIPASYRDDHDLPSSCHHHVSSCHHHDASSSSCHHHVSSCHHHDASSSSCHHHVSSCHHHDASSSSCHHHGRHDRGSYHHDLQRNNRTSSRRGVSYHRLHNKRSSCRCRGFGLN